MSFWGLKKCAFLTLYFFSTLKLPDLKDAEAVQKFFLEEIQLGEELLSQGNHVSVHRLFIHEICKIMCMIHLQDTLKQGCETHFSSHAAQFEVKWASPVNQGHNLCCT